MTVAGCATAGSSVGTFTDGAAVAVGTTIPLGILSDRSSPVPIEPATTAPTAPTTTAPVVVTFEPASGAVDVRPDSPVVVTASGARITAMAVSTPAGPAPGTFAGGHFQPVGSLEFGQTYTVSATVEAADGETSVHRSTFATLAPVETISAEITPEEGDVVGVGHPIIVRFSDPVPPEQQAAVAARLSVATIPQVAGSWRWMSDSAVHWRPLEYWPANTNVWVAAKLAGQAAGDRWFTESTLRNFSIGEHHRITVDLSTFQMVAYAGGTPVRTMGISGGTARYPTASGIDLIMEKHNRFEMDSTSVGIYGAEAYNVTVDDAQRLTNSGTFLHAAPWNGSLGEANLSHGCINASNADAQWMMDFTLIGDPVEIVGSDEQVSPTNGWGDWNIPAAEWAQPIG
jgi:lipoprotein-anchoring transpeptidase ErfK/SrfK